MRTLLMLSICTCVGVSIGGVRAWREFADARESFEAGAGENIREIVLSSSAKAEGKSLPPEEGVKVLVVNGETHDFGSTGRGGGGQHQFLFKNEGTKTLKIESGGTSCSACTVSDLPKKTIEPGETLPITVKYKPSTPDPEFRKEAYILTNDPKRPTVVLVVMGRVVEPVRIDPPSLTVGNITSTSELVLEARLISNLGGDFEVTGFELTNKELAKQFEVSVEPSDTMDAEATKARRTYRIQVKVKPGLPLGSLLQSVRINTTDSANSAMELPIRGQVVSDVSILSGRNFDSQTNILTLGIVPQAKGAKATLPLLIKGPLRDSVEVSIERTDPEKTIVATLGMPKSINDGAVRMVPLTVEIPAGAMPVNRMGGANREDYGRVIIATTHPEAPRLQVLVRFAVE
ncbi:MAG: hypothetical protein RLY70_3358 [Planctomycetota bacterium]|jgi:hypothetical protein